MAGPSIDVVGCPQEVVYAKENLRFELRPDLVGVEPARGVRQFDFPDTRCGVGQTEGNEDVLQLKRNHKNKRASRRNQLSQ